MKCVIFSRVSTESQDAESQLVELRKKAIELGYTHEDIIEIDETESAVALDIEHRAGVRRLFDKISEGDVNLVLIWEISRLSRRTDVGNCILYKLRDAHVDLFALKENIHLLDAQYNFENNSLLMYSMFFSIAASEADTIKARTRRGREARIARGLPPSGALAIGYKIENNKIVIDEKLAPVIRQLFIKYSEGAMGRKAMTTWFNSLVDKPLHASTIYRMLRNEAYKGGETLTSTTRGVTYPAIVTATLWNKCQEKRETNYRTAIKSQEYHTAHRLLICQHCHRPLTVHNKVYYCSASEGAMPTCAGTQIASYIADMIVWEAVRPYAQMMTQMDIATERKRLSAVKDELTSQISVLRNRLNEADIKIARAEEIYIETGNKERYNKSVNAIKDSVSDDKRSLSNKEAQLAEVIQSLNADDGRNILRIGNEWSTLSDEEKSRLCRKYIEKVELKTTHDENKTANNRITTFIVHYANLHRQHAPAVFRYKQRLTLEVFDGFGWRIIARHEGRGKLKLNNK